MFDLTGKCALVTGASGGIGAEIARYLHKAGASVGVTGTRVEPLQALADELGDRVHVLPCNLLDPEAVEALPAQAVDAMGSVDILVNNAGITRDGLLMRMPDKDWLDVYQVNVTAPMQLSRGLMRAMMKARWGRIINIGSIVGSAGNAGQTNYASSKGAVVAFTKSLAEELAPRGVTVNCVSPGFIATAMTDKLTDQQKQALIDEVPLGRMGTPEEIAVAVLFLASTEAGYITGETLHVNGAMQMF